MMDNIRRNVDDKKEYLNYNIKENSNSRHDGGREQDIKVHEEIEEDNEMDDVEEMKRKKKDFNKLDTVTTVPQLQQKFNKFNIIDEAAITTNTTATTLKTTCITAAKTSTKSSSSLINNNISLTQQKNTALAKFNRIIDNTVPVINAYNYQQHVAQTLVKSSEQHLKQQQHPHYHQTQEKKYVEMPILSDSLKRRLTNNHHQYTDISVSNSKINFSSAAITTASALSTSKDIVATAALTTSKAAATTALAMLANSSSQQEKEQKQEINTASSLDEDEQLKRNDVHYLLKQLNSFSDIEEIEIVDMKQKQRVQQQQQQQKQQLQEQIYSKKKNHKHQQQSPQHLSATSEPNQHVDRVEQLCFSEYQHVERIRQHVDIVETKFDTNVSMPQTTQHVSSDQFRLSAPEIQLQTEAYSEQHVDDSHQAIVVGKQTYTNAESKQHFETISTTSPTATSLVIYSPSSQSHKGIRRYASHDEHATSYHLPNHRSPHHHHYHHHHMHPHHLYLPHEHCSEGSILESAAAEAAITDPLILQQFVDDYIFQSCHYLETNNFVANYRTAMVESSSHEFRPSTTTTMTRTSNEEFYEGEGAGYVEDHSSAHSFELHETEPPTVICKAPAPLAAVSRLKQQQQYTMETRLCNSGVQTDLTASSLAQSFSLSSSLSSSEKRKRRQPLFKCCYTPLDRWREKRSQQQQSQIEKRTKSATATAATTTTNITTEGKFLEPQKSRKQQRQQHEQIITKNTSVAVVGGPSSSVSCSSAILNSIAATTTSTTTTTIINTASTLVVQPQHQHHHQSLLKNKNAPYPV